MTRIVFLLFIISIVVFEKSHSQSWTAIIEIDINHGKYAKEQITSATATFSGISQSVSSQPNSYATFTISGTGNPSGSLSISVNGTATFPYSSSDAASRTMAANYSGSGYTNMNCSSYAFNNYASGDEDELSGTIIVYREVGNAIINNSFPDCGVTSVDLSLQSAQPAGSTFNWQVSDNTQWITFKSNAASAITATLAELYSATPALTNAYAERKIRAVATECAYRISSTVSVTFKPGYTTVTPTWTPPICNGMATGSLKLEFESGGVGTSYDDFQIDLDHTTVNKYDAQLTTSDGSAIMLSNLLAGTYNIKVRYTFDLKLCPTEKSEIFGQPSAVSAVLKVSEKGANSAGVKFNVSCKGGTDGSLELYTDASYSTRGATGGTPGTTTRYTYSWANSTTTLDRRLNLSAQNYEVTIKDSKGCELKLNKTLTSPTTDPTLTLKSVGGDTINYPAYDVSCDAVTDGAIQASVTSQVATGTPTFDWIGSISTAALRTNLGNGTYSATATDGNGCAAAQQSITLTNRPDPVVTVIPTHPTCPNTSTGILEVTGVTNATTPLSYKWSSNETTAKITGKAEGSYTVTVTDAKGCKGLKTQPLTDPAEYDVTVTRLTAISCNGGSNGKVQATVLNGSGATATDVKKYSWKRDNVTYKSGPNLHTIDTLRDAVYQCTVTYGTNNCTAIDSYNLVQPAKVSPTITVTSNYFGSEITCPNRSDGSLLASATGGQGPYTYKWSTGETTAAISGKPKGTYKVIATDSKNCVSAEVSETLNDPTPVSALITKKTDYNGVPIRCYGNNDAWLQASATGGSGILSYVWNTGATGIDLDSIGAGTYQITVTDQNQCAVTDTETVTQPDSIWTTAAITSDYHGQHLSCFNSSDAALKVTPKGGRGGYTYSWSNGATSASINGLPAGTYTATIQDLNNCPSQPVSVVVENPEPVEVSIEIDTLYNGKPIRCHDASDGMLSASASGGTNVFAYLWSSGETGNELTGLTEGLYQITATDENGCHADTSVYLDAPEPIEAMIDSISDYNGFGITCVNATDASIEASAIGGTPVYSYSWLATTERSSRLSEIGAGTYAVEVKDANGCTDTISTVITSPPQLTLGVSSKSDISCFDGNNGSITVAASGGVSNFMYRINADDWIDTAAFVGLEANTHEVEVRDANGCIASTSETLLQPEEISISFADIQPSYCSEPRGEVRAVVAGGTPTYEYEWRNTDNVFIDSVSVIDSLNAGLYILSVSDANGCFKTQSIGISSTDGPGVFLEESVQPSCAASFDGRIEVSALGNGPFTYAWSNGQTNNRADNLGKGTYNVTVTDTFGCITVQALPLSAPTEVKIISFEKTQPSCNGMSDGKIIAIAEGGVGSYEYYWTSYTGQEISGIPAGKYSVKAKDDNGCESKTSTVDLGQPTALQLSLVSRTLPTCYASCDGKMEVKASGANGAYSYVWGDSTINESRENLCAGDHQVTVVDAKGCQLQKTYSLGQPDQIKTSLVKSVRPTCFEGCNGSIEVNASGGNGDFAFLWNNGSTSNKNENICAGKHYVTVTDKSGCKSAEEPYDLTQPASIASRLLTNISPSCHSDCDGTLQVEGSGGNGTYLYKWSNGATTSSTNKLCAGDYSVTITDVKGCQLKDKLYTVTEPELLTVELKEKTLSLCHDACFASLMVEASGGNSNYKYAWSSGGSDARVANLCPGDYQVSITDSKSCSVSATYTIENPAPLTIDLGGSLLVCVGQEHVLDPGGSWSKFQWGSNNGLSSTAQRITISEQGQYWVDVENLEGCSAQDTFLLETSADLLEAGLAMASEAHIGDTIVIIDISWPLPDNIDWTYPQQMAVLGDYGDVIYGQFYETGTFDITLDAALGNCREKLTKRITILSNTSDEIGGRLGYEEFVKQFELYPNPNDGDFDVAVELAEEGPITLSVWSTLTSLNIGIVKDEGRAKYLTHVDLRPLTSGTYVLRLDHPKGHQSIRFVVH